ncbi:hypothetical protein BDR07DRAFT_1422751, partial [Suillus spraguei]
MSCAGIGIAKHILMTLDNNFVRFNLCASWGIKRWHVMPTNAHFHFWHLTTNLK